MKTHEPEQCAVPQEGDEPGVARSRSAEVDERPPRGGSRDEALDYVKGCLVLVMVLYHWANYFVGPDWNGYRYLRFLTPSFIFITGFIVSRVYLAKYAYDSPTLRWRLVLRGAKLLVLFGVLNLADTAAGVRGFDLSRLAAWWPASRVYAVFVRGDGAAAFSILLVIAYFLLLAPAVLAVSKRAGVTLASIAGAVLAVTVGMSVVGIGKPNIEFISIALAGLAFGAGESRAFDGVVTRPGLLLPAYAFYLAAITVWNVPFPLQVIGVYLSVSLLYALGKRRRRIGVITRQVTDLGKYSLFSYVVQIAALQLLRWRLPLDDSTGPSLGLPLVAAALITMGAVQLTAALRARWTVADRLYRLVFA